MAHEGLWLLISAALMKMVITTMLGGLFYSTCPGLSVASAARAVFGLCGSSEVWPVIPATSGISSQQLESKTLFCGFLEETLEFLGDSSRKFPQGLVWHHRGSLPPL